jgi:diguanylate cyclase (GGDEF)-like protein
VQTLQRTVDAQAEALRNAKQKLSQDPLPQIANRRALDQELPRLVAEAQATGAPLTVLALDIDHFKAVNDTYGHAAGDVVLKAVAQKAASLLRSEDLLARAGGEEFVALLPGTPLPVALKIAERIRSGIESLPFSQGAVRFTVTMSIGVSQLTATEEGADALARADAALYQAKHGGRNQSIAA